MTAVRSRFHQSFLRFGALACLLLPGVGIGCQLLWPVNEFDGVAATPTATGSDAESEASEDSSQPEAEAEAGTKDSLEIDSGSEVQQSDAKDAGKEATAEDTSPSNTGCGASKSDWTLLGVAAWDQDRLRLTPVQQPEVGTGSAWCHQLLDLSKDFEIAFDFSVGNKDVPGSDGIWFTLLPERLGDAGFPADFRGVSPSFCVEYDTFCNAGEPCWVGTDGWLLSEDHIGVVIGGSTLHPSNLPVTNVPNLEGEGVWRTLLRWTAQEQLLEVLLKNPSGTWSSVLTYQGDIVGSYLKTPRVQYGIVALTSPGSDYNSMYIVP